MTKNFKNVGDVSFEKLTIGRINELTNLIHETYQREGIWLTYSKADIEEELICSFTNLVYKPTYFIALLNDKIIGVASYMWSHTSSNVFELSFGTVKHDYQRKGIGKHLTLLRLQEIISLSEDYNCVIIAVARRPKLFEQFGFKTVCKMKNENEESDCMFCQKDDLKLF